MLKAACSAVIASSLAVAGCGREAAGDGADLVPVAGEEASPAGDPVPPAPAEAPPAPPVAPSSNGAAATAPTAGENDGVPDITPAPLSPDAARTETGARALLLAWARGIELREFNQAWALMGDAARAQLPKAQFNDLFQPLRAITVAVPGGQIEGAAGSSYYTAPATITGSLADGGRKTLTGEVVLRRVNDVPGSSAEQRAWHIERVTLRPG